MNRSLTALLTFVALLAPNAMARPELGERPARSGSPLSLGAESLAHKDGVTDPTGDTFGVGATQIDVIDYSVEIEDSSVVVTATFSDVLLPPDDPSNDALQGLIDFDTDQNGGTGLVPWSDFLTSSDVSGIGSEYYVDLASFSNGSADVIFDDGSAEGGVTSGQAAVTILSNLLQVDVPFSALGGDDGGVNSTAIFGTVTEFTDRVPNNGSVGTEVVQPDNTILLNNGRFRVGVVWSAPGFSERDAFVSDLRTDDTGFFYFLSPDNIEFLIKVINGCGFNNNYWVFFAGATDVGFTVTVTDTQANQTQTYTNPVGQPADAVTDTGAFATCP